MSLNQPHSPTIYSILEFDTNSIAGIPNFVEYETNQAIINLNIDPIDLVPLDMRNDLLNQQKNLSKKIKYETKRLQIIQKIMNERNRLLNPNADEEDTTEDDKAKYADSKKKKPGKKKLNNENTEIKSKIHKNPRFSKISNQPKEKDTKEENQFPISQPKGTNSNIFLRKYKFIQKEQEAKKQNNLIQKEEEAKKSNGIIQNFSDEENEQFESSEESSRKNYHYEANKLVPDESARRKKYDELLRKREGYNKLKERQWKEYLREQEKRKKLLYKSKNTNQIDKFREKIQTQNEKDMSNGIVFSPSKLKKNQQETNAEVVVEEVKKRRIRKKKKNPNKKQSVDNDQHDSMPQNLIESAKKDPEIIIPNHPKRSKKKKCRRRSKIPRFVPAASKQ